MLRIPTCPPRLASRVDRLRASVTVFVTALFAVESLDPVSPPWTVGQHHSWVVVVATDGRTLPRVFVSVV